MIVARVVIRAFRIEGSPRTGRAMGRRTASRFAPSPLRVRRRAWRPVEGEAALWGAPPGQSELVSHKGSRPGCPGRSKRPALGGLHPFEGPHEGGDRRAAE